MKEKENAPALKERKLTEEEAELIFKGIRPEGMEQERFKFHRYMFNRYMKGRLKGYMFHTSSEVVPVEGTKGFQKITRTYRKNV